jgi:CRISPR-associated endonuclease/helicase Cas3
MEFYSHLEPEKILLKKHLEYVGEKSKEIIESKEFNMVDKEVIADISYLIGIAHDFGKYTTFFQNKLNGYPSGEEANHGLVSALFAFELVKRYLMGRTPEKEASYKFLPLIAYFVVKHHHGDLKDIKDDIDVKNLFDGGFRNICKQLKDIKSNRKQIEEEYAFLLQDYDIQTDDLSLDLAKYERDIRSSEDIKPLITELDKSAYYFRHKNEDIIYYLLVQLLYSALIDADKRHAGRVREIERKKLSDNLVELYLSEEEFKKENESKINPIRTEIRKSVLKNVESGYKNQIFTITAPTGTGKTLTSLSAALKLRKLLKNELNLGYEPRIIYSLPFTSIIDQNFEVFDHVLSQIKDFEENQSQYLLKHHHLSEIFYKTADMDKEKDVDESLALIESWESEIIVTTFIQLFHTLIGYKNRSLKKFHNIVNSIIILDEVQNIPIEYWNLVQEVLKAMANYFNCRIILMTATKPLIFEEGEYKELVDNSGQYFESEELNRVCLHIGSERKQILDFCEELVDLSMQSYLFVFNTIGASLEFYDEIKEGIQESDFRLYYLSTNIVPKERRKRIEEIRELIKNNKEVVVVSTQLIEAGVDVDCDCVYRDMAPLDSIIQVAGRCNRNKRNELGKVEVIDLSKINEKGEEKRYADYIYDKELLKIVRDLLEDKREIMEKDFLEMVNEYFKEARAKSRMEKELIKSIYELYFYDKTPDETKRKPISKFELIKEDYYKIDVFVEMDDKARDVWEEYEKIKNNKNLEPYERKKEFLKIKRQFYDYVISIPQIYASDFRDDKIGHVSNEELKNYYDLETGFKRGTAGNGVMIC